MKTDEKSKTDSTIDEKNKAKTKMIHASYDETWDTATLYCTEDYFNNLGKDVIYDLLCSKLGFERENI